MPDANGMSAPPPSDVLDRLCAVGGGGVPPHGPPPPIPPPPPPIPMFEADSPNFALAPSVPRGFTLQKCLARLRRGTIGRPSEDGVPANPPPPSSLHPSPHPHPVPPTTPPPQTPFLEWHKGDRTEAPPRPPFRPPPPSPPSNTPLGLGYLCNMCSVVCIESARNFGPL